MTAIHVPGTGVGPHGGKHVRRGTVIAAVLLAGVAIMVPFVLRSVGNGGAQASATPHASTPAQVKPAHQRHASGGGRLGPRGDLPDLLPGHSRLTDGVHVRLGDVTSGVLRRTPVGGWRVLVRWNDRVQAVPVRGPVGLGGGAGGRASASWVSDRGLLYTRVATAGPGQFRVYEWRPHGGSAYTPPTLVATDLGRVCFNRSFTAFGDCRTAG